MSMPTYAGGDLDIAGFKWAAEAKDNLINHDDVPLGIDITGQVLRKIDIVDRRPPKPYNPKR